MNTDVRRVPADPTDWVADTSRSPGTFGRSCRLGGCAHLCTEEGLRAADRLYRGRLLARARQIVVDPDLAEEAVQEALLRGWRACASFDPAGGPLLNWLLVITRNVAVDLVKARLRRPAVSSASHPDTAESGAAPSSGISEMDLLLLRAQLHEALTQLDAHHRAAVVETILRDRPTVEVAAELSIPAGTVRTRVHYGLRRLRGLLEATDQAA
jgi:RNA polymerase sigma-70 factor (ECF subfamily)